jgi:hypothetical protein
MLMNSRLLAITLPRRHSVIHIRVHYESVSNTNSSSYEVMSTVSQRQEPSLRSDQMTQEMRREQPESFRANRKLSFVDMYDPISSTVYFNVNGKPRHPFALPSFGQKVLQGSNLLSRVTQVIDIVFGHCPYPRWNVALFRKPPVVMRWWICWHNVER